MTSLISAKYKILIAASGSGGHILPALFIASALKELTNNNIEIEFFGTGKSLEVKLIEGAGYKLHKVPVSGISGRGLLGFVQFIINFPKVIFETFKVLKTFQPNLVLGVGGYSSFYPVTAARLKSLPTWIHEAESKPGLANKVLSKYATKISTAFDVKAFPSKKMLITGHPVRPEILEVKAKDSTTIPHNLFLMGGSQGAKALDIAMAQIAPFLKERNLSILHQARAENIDIVSKSYEASGLNAEVISFIDDMVLAYNWSDIIISRSGAGSVAEVSAINRPVIFVPLPSSQADHQKFNAKVLEKQGKAIVVEEGSEFESRLKIALSKILDQKNYSEMLQKKQRDIPLNAAHSIANGCLTLMKESIKQVLK